MPLLKKKDRIKIALLLLVLICVTAGCVSTPDAKNSTREPEWIKNPASAYAKDAYLYAIGDAPTLQNAQDIAMENMARLFSTTVQSDRTVRERYSRAVKNGAAADSVTTDMDTNVRTSANVSALIGVSLDKTWTSPEGRCYVLAALDRRKARDEYVRMITANNKTIADLTAAAEAEKGTLKAYSCRSLSAVLAEMNNEYITILAVVDPATSKAQAAICGQPNQYKMQAKEEAQNITFALSVTGDKESRLTQSFAAVLQDFGFKTAGNGGTMGVLKYTLIVQCSLSPTTMSGNDDMKFARYEIKAVINDVSSGKTVYSYSDNGRSAHMSQEEANQKALRSAEKKIREEFARDVTTWLDSLSGITG